MRNKISSVQLTENNARELRTISVFSGIPQSQIISEFIEDLFRKFRPFIFKAIKTGNYINYDVNLKAELNEVDMVTGQFPVPFDTTIEEDAEIKSKTFDEIEKQFSRLDRQKEENKKIFRKCLDSNFPQDPEETKPKEPKIEEIHEKIRFECEVV
jgi:hypothetical protein